MSDEGYEFVPLPDAVRRVDRPEARHDRRAPEGVTARLSVTLVAEQPVHVGSGFKALRDGAIVRQCVTSSGRLCIPGSTLKGVLRARFESVTRSCALFLEKDRPVKVRSSSYPNAKAVFTPNVSDADLFRACKGDRCCPACALFGRMSLRSRVLVSDLVAAATVAAGIDLVAEMFSPNLHHVGEFTDGRDPRGDTLLTVHKLHGRKFARGRGPETDARERIEVIPAGTALVGEVRVSNLTRAEYGGLLVALGVAPMSRLKVGGAKGHGFGRVRVELGGVSVHPGGGSLTTSPSEFEAAFFASPDAWTKGVEALVSIHAPERAP